MTVLQTLADRIERSAGPGIYRVGIDGVDGAGKTTFGDNLAAELRRRGRTIIRSGIDGFHHPRALRYRLGRDSPEGFFRDTTNLAGLRTMLLDPLRPGGNKKYRPAIFDHRSDATIESKPMVATGSAILVFDGIFLHRPELADNWDLSVFLDVPFATSYARMAVRDGSDPNPNAPSNRRYRDGQRLYFAECSPQQSCDVLIDYADLDNPRIVRS